MTLPTIDVTTEFQGDYPRLRAETRYLVVHHAAARYGTPTGLEDVRAVDRYHRSKGWGGIGYHIALAETTNGGSITRYVCSDLRTIRAGVAHRNHETLHVCCLTDFGRDVPHPKWITALATTLRDLLEQFPGAAIVGHRDIALGPDASPDGRSWLTRCPGDAWPRWRDALITAATADAPILGRSTLTTAQLLRWIAPRAHASYTDADIHTILDAYQIHGERVGIDWGLAVVQCLHETGVLTSFWSLRPQRNPAGLGVTGEHAPSRPLTDAADWAYNAQRGRWERGLRFATWADHAIPAHLGRLLAYALTPGQATPDQQALIDHALRLRPLPDALRGAASTWTALNGRWAVPGTTYGQAILRLARQIRSLA